MAEAVYKALGELLVDQFSGRGGLPKYVATIRKLTYRLNRMPRYENPFSKEYLRPVRITGGLFNYKKTLRKRDYGTLLFTWR